MLLVLLDRVYKNPSRNLHASDIKATLNFCYVLKSGWTLVVSGS